MVALLNRTCQTMFALLGGRGRRSQILGSLLKLGMKMTALDYDNSDLPLK